MSGFAVRAKRRDNCGCGDTRQEQYVASAYAFQDQRVSRLLLPGQ